MAPQIQSLHSTEKEFPCLLLVQYNKMVTEFHQLLQLLLVNVRKFLRRRLWLLQSTNPLPHQLPAVTTAPPPPPPPAHLAPPALQKVMRECPAGKVLRAD